MDTHYEDWVVSCSIDTCELSDADTIHILNKAYENGLWNFFRICGKVEPSRKPGIGISSSC